MCTFSILQGVPIPARPATFARTVAAACYAWRGPGTPGTPGTRSSVVLKSFLQGILMILCP